MTDYDIYLKKPVLTMTIMSSFRSVSNVSFISKVTRLVTCYLVINLQETSVNVDGGASSRHGLAEVVVAADGPFSAIMTTSKIARAPGAITNVYMRSYYCIQLVIHVRTLSQR